MKTAKALGVTIPQSDPGSGGSGARFGRQRTENASSVVCGLDLEERLAAAR
jgi:hypothetical protein